MIGWGSRGGATEREMWRSGGCLGTELPGLDVCWFSGPPTREVGRSGRRPEPGRETRLSGGKADIFTADFACSFVRAGNADPNLR